MTTEQKIQQDIKKIVCLDFDGTLVRSDYPDILGPIPGMIEFTHELKKRGYYIIVYSARISEFWERYAGINDEHFWENVKDIHNCLKEHKFQWDEIWVKKGKPPGIMIDDSCIEYREGTEKSILAKLESMSKKYGKKEKAGKESKEAGESGINIEAYKTYNIVI